MDRLCIEHLSVFGLPPVDFVTLVADLGCGGMSLGPRPVAEQPGHYAPWDLLSDMALRRETKAALRDRGVTLAQSEGYLILPGLDVSTCRPILDLMHDLGAARANIVAVDPDMARVIDQFGAFARDADERGMQVTLEFMPILAVNSAETALSVIRQSGAANSGLLIDAMHFFRSGGSPEQLAAMQPDDIAYVQICDAPWAAPMEAYGEEARYQRMMPGKGELPLAELLAAVPHACPVGLEVPLQREALAGIGPAERLRPCVDAARALLTALDAQSAG